MVPGCAGTAIGVTAKLVAGELPHPLATTVILPAVAVGVAEIVVVVEVPVQPDGSVQV